MPKMSRRNVLKSGAAFAAGTAAMGTGVRYVEASDRAGAKYNWGHTIEFGAQYYLRVLEILENVRRNEMTLFADVSTRMAEAVKKGGKVWYDAYVGHMGTIECLEGNKGNPGIIISNPDKIKFDQMKPGDVLVTNNVSKDIRDAREKGVYVVGIPVNYIDNEWTPRGFVTPNVNNWLLGDVTSVILQSYIPYTQGVVDCPEIPEMKLCPSSANSLCSIFWMFQCELANKLKNPKAKPLDKGPEFLDTVIGRLRDTYRLQKDFMFDNAPIVAKLIGNGGHFHCTSDHGGVQSESNGVAMGPMMTNAFRGAMKKGDVHLLATIEPDSKMIVDEAKKAKDLGIFVVSIAPGNSLQIRRYSDVFIDNFSPEGGGLLDIAGIAGKVGTVGGVMNNMLMWIFTAQFLDEMVRRGWIPWFWMGFYQAGGREYDEAVKRFFNSQGF
jgi:uncharacterized phosphosugar-binding protein